MLFAAGILLYLAVWAALLHYHGCVSDELAATRAELEETEERLVTWDGRLQAWARRLDAQEARLIASGRCHSAAECARNVSRAEAYERVIAAYDELVDGIATNLAADGSAYQPGGDAGAVPSSAAPATPDADRPGGPHLYVPGGPG